MRIQNRVTKGQQHNDTIRFHLDGTAEQPLGKPAGKMITDSDEMSFVYLMDDIEGYAHIHFPQEVWAFMVEALRSEEEPMLQWNEKSIPLPGFKEELTMLIYNIEGNDNYGEAFTTAVEQEFQAILQRIEI